MENHDQTGFKLHITSKLGTRKIYECQTTRYQKSNAISSNRKLSSDLSDEEGLKKEVVPLPNTAIKTVQGSYITLLIFAQSLVIDKVVKFNVCHCKYQSVLIPYCFILASLQTLLEEHGLQSYNQKLLIMSCQQLNRIKSAENTVCYEVIADCLAFQKYQGNPDYYLQKLRSFLSGYQQALGNFAPLYFGYFRMIADFRTIFKSVPSIREVVAYVGALQKQVRQKYHNINVDV